MTSTAIVQTLLLALSVGLASGGAAQPVAQAPAKVVFQVSDGDAAKWNLALSNARNVQQELGADKVQIEIVAYGPGIGMLKADSPVSSRVAQAVKAGVEMVACENTMIAQNLTEADMAPSISYVMAGVVQLMKRQSQGWAYIRP
jgi:uncharacterized protein